jgi:hypothetical protein
MSTSVYYKDAKLIDVNNNTKTLLTAGKYLEDDVTLTDNTLVPSGTSYITENGTYDITSFASANVSVSSGQTYTATISGSGDAHYCFVKYNNITYAADGNTFSYKAGDTLTIRASGQRAGGEIWINSNRVAYDFNVAATYTYTLPAHDINIDISYLSYGYIYIKGETISITSNGAYDVDPYAIASVNVPIPSGYIQPIGTSTIIENGIYDVTDYASASVNVPLPSGHDAVLLNAGTYNTTMPMYTYVSYNGTRYYTNEDTFNFNEGDTIQTLMYGIGGNSNVYLNNTLIGSGMTVSFSAPSYPLTVYFSNGDGIHFNKAYPSGTLSITSNGTYSVYGYSSADVNVVPTYTATITKGSPVGISVYYNNTLYSSTGSTFTYSPGDNLSVYIYQFNSKYSTTELLINGETVVKNTDGTTINYNYSLPAANINLSYNYGFNPYNQLHIAEQIIPSNTLTGLSYGICNVYGYSSVDTKYGELAIYKTLADGYDIVMTGSTSYTSTDAINYCNSLTSISANQFIHRNFVPSGATFENVTNIGAKAFASVYYGVVSGDYKGSLTYSFPNVSIIGSMAFLSNFFIRSIYANNCSLIGSYAFCDCRSLKTISFPNCSSIDAGAFDCCSLLSEANFPVCQTIGSYGFRSCYSLSSISFPNCSFIETSAFHNCSTLTTASFPECSDVGNSAFYNCTRLATVYFPSCTIIRNYTFTNCKSLTTVNFPSCTKIFTGGFSDCTNLTTANFSNCQDLATGVFYHCSALTTISFPVCSVIGYQTFQGCISLTSINFPECVSISASAFAFCSALTTISFSKCSVIGVSAFASCFNLTTVNFPSCTTISSGAFYGCSNLTTISLPICTDMQSSVFRNCYNLISLYLDQVSAVPNFGTNMFYSTPISTYSTVAGRYGSIFVPSSLYASFTTAISWSAYSARMVSV